MIGRPPGETSFANELTKDERHDFRTLAEHPDIVEQIIAQSTDTRPPSRAKVLDAIAATTKRNQR